MPAQPIQAPAAPTSAARRPAGPRPRKVLAAHLQGDTLRLVTARAGAAGEPPLVVEDARSIAAAALSGNDPTPRSGVDCAVIVLPTFSAVGRVVPGEFPQDGDPATLAGVASLLAEAHLGSAPAHRRSAGVLQLSEHGPSATAVVGWLGTTPPPLLALSEARRIDAWLPEFVALAWLARVGRAGTASGGDASAGAVSVYADRRTGEIAVVAAGPERVWVRNLVEDPEDDWRGAVLDACEQCLEAAGAEGVEPVEPAPDHDVTLVVNGAAQLGSRLGGVPADPAWLREYGVALGGAAWALMAAPSERTIGDLRQEPPSAGSRWVTATVNWFSVPLRAGALIAACLVVLMLIPLATSYARVQALRREVERTAGSDQALRLAEEADLYALARERSWPVTRLLAELVGTAPRDVSIDAVTIKVGDPVRVAGTSESPDAVTRWRAELAQNRVFENVQIPRSASDPGGAFELTARIAQPLLALAGDPAAIERANREAARNATIIETPSAPPATTARAPVGPGRTPLPAAPTNRRTTGRNGTAGAPAAPAGTPLPAADRAAVAVPRPLTDAQISAMDRATVVREFGERRRASLQSGISPEERARLENEVAKLRERLQSGGGS